MFWPHRAPRASALVEYPDLGRTHPLRQAFLGLVPTWNRNSRVPLRISDLLTARAWRRTPLRQAALPETSDQMCLPITFSGNGVQAVTLSRTTGTFTDRQRDLLASAAPHLRAAIGRIAPTRQDLGFQLSPRPGWVPLLQAPTLTPPPGPSPRLSRREHEVLTLVAQGLTDAHIAARLGIRPATVSKHLHRTYERHALPNRAAAITLLSS